MMLIIYVVNVNYVNYVKNVNTIYVTELYYKIKWR